MTRASGWSSSTETGSTKYAGICASAAIETRDLARRLARMGETGLIARESEGGYRLTDAGEATLPILHAYAAFTRTVDPDGPWGLRVTCADCGTIAASADRCDTCGATLDTDGTVLHSELVDEITTEPDYDAALAVL